MNGLDLYPACSLGSPDALNTHGVPSHCSSAGPEYCRVMVQHTLHSTALESMVPLIIRSLQCVPLAQALDSGGSQYTGPVMQRDGRQCLVLECPAMQCVRDRYPALFKFANNTMQLFIWQRNIVGVAHFIQDCFQVLGALDDVSDDASTSSSSALAAG